MRAKLTNALFRSFSTLPRPQFTARIPINGPVSLITGNFNYFSIPEKEAIQAVLNKGLQALVILFDNDNPVPANERAMWLRRHFKYHTNLAIHVAYELPDEKAGHQAYAAYIQKQIPQGVSVQSVSCNNAYSPYLAKLLRVPLTAAKSRVTFEQHDAAISLDPEAHKDHIVAIARARIIHPFKNIVDPTEFKNRCDEETIPVLTHMQKQNPHHPNKNSFFKRTVYDTNQLNKINYPVSIGYLDEAHRRAFSAAGNTQVYDMPLYMPGQGWKIPTDLTPYIPFLVKVIAAERLANPDLDNCNVFLTTDRGVVPPNKYARREGPHVDGFLTPQNELQRHGVVWGDFTYLVSDNPYLQTQFYPGPFDLSDINSGDPKAVLATFEKGIANMPYRQYNPYEILRLDTNNVHAVQCNLTGFDLDRAFGKITISYRQFNRRKNTANPNLDYKYAYVARDAGRNTQNHIGLPPPGYEKIDLSGIDFKQHPLPAWAKGNSFKVTKNPDVRITAVPAKVGEKLDTVVAGLRVTTNVAHRGDMKVTRIEGDSYFLGGSKFSFLYRPTENKDEFAPIPRSLSALKTNKDISFVSPWGTLQNLPEGSCVIQAEDGETWGVHEESFNATYQLK